MNQKNKDIKNLEKRKDFQQILAMNDPEFKEINKCMESIVEEELQQIQHRKNRKIEMEKNRWLIDKIE